MIFVVSLTRAGHRDLEGCYAFIAKRSPRGAAAWTDAFQRHVLDALCVDPHSYELAPESRDHAVEIRQKFFRTRQGRNYRSLFTVQGQNVFIIHIRGPGQDFIPPDELKLP
ncbi:MAG: type II toxin-antitoxin system RelE/ParE family toxin [Pirellulaceae bacterium]